MLKKLAVLTLPVLLIPFYMASCSSCGRNPVNPAAPTQTLTVTASSTISVTPSIPPTATITATATATPLVWRNNVIHVYTWENTGNRGEDSVGSLDLTMIGSPSFSTDPSDIKYNTSWNNNSDYNQYFSSTPGWEAMMQGLSEWSIQCWYKAPPLEGNVGNKADVLLMHNSNVGTWTTGDCEIFNYYTSSLFVYGARYNGTEISFYSSLAEGWHFISFERSTTSGKIWIDGVAIASTTDSTNTFINDGQATFFGRFANGYTFYGLKGRMERLVITNNAQAGVEATPGP